MELRMRLRRYHLELGSNSVREISRPALYPLSYRGSDFHEGMVGCFGLNGPLRQYFSLYRAVSQREGERKEKR